MTNRVDERRRIQRESWVGKTIESVDASIENMLYFKFTDGTTVALEAELGSYQIPTMVQVENES